VAAAVDGSALQVDPTVSRETWLGGVVSWVIEGVVCASGGTISCTLASWGYWSVEVVLCGRLLAACCVNDKILHHALAQCQKSPTTLRCDTLRFRLRAACDVGPSVALRAPLAPEGFCLCW
jgi:hypothetical protein